MLLNIARRNMTLNNLVEIYYFEQRSEIRWERYLGTREI
jgi:hypothetical protein